MVIRYVGEAGNSWLGHDALEVTTPPDAPWRLWQYPGRRQPRPLSRRSLMKSALLTGVVAAAPALGRRTAHAAPLPQPSPDRLTLVTNRAPSDLDPHSAYDAGS